MRLVGTVSKRTSSMQQKPGYGVYSAHYTNNIAHTYLSVLVDYRMYSCLEHRMLATSAHCPHTSQCLWTIECTAILSTEC